MNIDKINVGGNLYDVCDTNARVMISDEYNSATQYSAGDYCIWENTLKKANKSTTGTYDHTAWDDANIGEVVGELNQNMSDFEDDLSGKQNKISNQTFKFTPNDAGITTSSIQCFRYGNVCIVTGTFTPNQAGTPLTLGSFNVHPTKAITFPINGYEKVASYGTLSASGVFQCNIPGAMANAPCAINFAFLTA